MNKLILIVITKTTLQLIHCEFNTTLPSFVWSGIRDNDQKSTFEIIRGYPDFYFTNISKGRHSKVNSYDWYAVVKDINSINYQFVTYDARKLYVGVYEINKGQLLIYNLEDILERKIYNPIFTISPHFHFSNVTGMAFATCCNLLYWVDADAKYVGVADFTKSRWTKIITSSIDIPYSVAVCETKRFLFWSDIGANPKIERSNLYGEERTVIVDSSLTQPINMVIDKQSEKLFWLDGTLLKKCDFNGDNIVSYEDFPEALNFKTFAIYKDIVVVPNPAANYLLAYKIYPGFNNLSLFSSILTHFRSVVSFSLDAKEFVANISNPCAYNLCNYLCLPQSDTSYVCKCSPGYILNSDERTCVSAITRAKTTTTEKNGSSKSVGFKLLVTQFVFLASKAGNLF